VFIGFGALIRRRAFENGATAQRRHIYLIDRRLIDSKSSKKNEHADYIHA
jgi:hypothetical protein